MAAAIWRKAKNCFLTLTTLLVFIGGLGEISIACELSVGAKICYQKVRFDHYIQLRSDDQMDQEKVAYENLSLNADQQVVFD